MLVSWATMKNIITKSKPIVSHNTFSANYCSLANGTFSDEKEVEMQVGFKNSWKQKDFNMTANRNLG